MGQAVAKVGKLCFKHLMGNCKTSKQFNRLTSPFGGISKTELSPSLLSDARAQQPSIRDHLLIKRSMLPGAEGTNPFRQHPQASSPARSPPGGSAGAFVCPDLCGRCGAQGREGQPAFGVGVQAWHTSPTQGDVPRLSSCTSGTTATEIHKMGSTGEKNERERGKKMCSCHPSFRE